MHLSHIMERLLCAVYPRRCASCDKIIPPDGFLCDECACQLVPAPGYVAAGRPFRSAASRYIYRTVSASVIKRYKFQGERRLAKLISQWLYEAYSEAYSSCSFDAVTCVPMTGSERCKKHFDHNSELAESFATKAGIAFMPQLLIKTRETEMQVRLNAAQRFDNLRGLYKASPDASGLRILVVDDVLTTGATLSECSRALLAAGAESVDALTATLTARG